MAQLPAEVQAALQRDFKGRPVTEGNLSEWRKGGYCEWLAQQDALDNIGELSAVAGELASAAPAVLADRLNTLITIHYAGKLIALNSAPDKNLDPREMIECSRIAVELQRGLQNAERIKIEQQRLELDRTKTEKDIIEQLLPLIEYPKSGNVFATKQSLRTNAASVSKRYSASSRTRQWTRPRTRKSG